MAGYRVLEDTAQIIIGELPPTRIISVVRTVRPMAQAARVLPVMTESASMIRVMNHRNVRLQN